jgi:hypothetical protein
MKTCVLPGIQQVFRRVRRAVLRTETTTSTSPGGCRSQQIRLLQAVPASHDTQHFVREAHFVPLFGNEASHGSAVPADSREKQEKRSLPASGRRTQIRRRVHGTDCRQTASSLSAVNHGGAVVADRLDEVGYDAGMSFQRNRPRITA